MANTIDVRNVSIHDVIVGDKRLAPGETYSFDRKMVVYGRYSPYNTYEASLYRDLAHALAATTPPITATYNGVALTAAVDTSGNITGTLSELAPVDNPYTDEEFEVNFSFDDSAVAGYSAWWQAPYDLTVTAIEFTAAVAIVANDGACAQFDVDDETNSNSLASQDTKTTGSGGTGNIAQWDTYSFPLTTTTADLDLAAGTAVSFVLTNPSVGAGVGVTGTLKIKYTRRVS